MARKGVFKKCIPVCLLALALALPSICLAQGGYDWMIFENLTEPLYTRAEDGYQLPVYQGSVVDMPADVHLNTGESAQVTVAAPEDGLYEIWFDYRNTTTSSLPTELTVQVDGTIPFFELRRMNFESLWVDDGVILTDRYMNQVAPKPRPADTIMQKGLSDSAARTARPFLFQLTAGVHTLSLTANDGSIKIENVSLQAPVMVDAYAPGDAAGDALILIEGERIFSRNKSDIRGAGEFSPNLSPYDSDKRLLNFLDGASFNEAGDSVTFQFASDAPGYYQMGFYYRQNGKTDFPVFVDIQIDSQMPSKAAQKIPFDYCTVFQPYTVMAEDAPQTFYLPQGEHTLTLTINSEILTPVYEEIDQILREINGLSLEVVRLTGGITTDRYRDYNLTTYIPDLKNILLGWALRCDALVDSMRVYTASPNVAAFSSLTVCAAQLRQLAQKPEDLPRRLAELSTGPTSAARILAQQLQDMARNNLSIDQIYLYQKDAKLPQKAGALTSVWEGVKRFFTSFGAQDYGVGNSNEESLQVWVARPRQYVEILQNMVDTRFTPETGIEVDISIMSDAQKIVLANASGDAPDVALGVQYVIPSYLNIRGALYDLTQFEDFAQVASRFPTGLFVPYILGDGVYAIPETINFWVMFYRKDIFQVLGIPVPDSMEEVKAILPELQRRNMNFYYPTAGMVGMKVFPGTLPLILQSGGSIYGDTVGNTTLDTEESLLGFRELTDLFTVYNMPTDVPAPGFYQQFRAGTLPIGIADLATYNLLLNAAPEIKGLWDIALFPGLTDADGTVSRWTTGGAETDVIFSTTRRAQDAWTFLKWWSSTGIQAEFGNTLQSTYGSEYIWNTANKEAFAQLPLQASHKQVVIAQTEWMTEAPWVLGTYMLERELSNAYISVVVNGTEARRAMDTAMKRINRETFRKLEEFGYYKDGVMLKTFVTPSMLVVERLLEEYRQNGGGMGE